MAQELLAQPLSLHTAGPDDEILERLLTRGASALSDAELLAILIRHGRPGESALGPAEDLLHACSGVQGLLTLDNDIARAQQLDPLQSAALLAAVEMSRRLTRVAIAGNRFEDPVVVARYLHLQFARVDQEVLGALFLNAHSRFLGQTELFRGAPVRILVEPRSILREALRRNAHGMILFHTHPSGDPEPSMEDVEFNYQMREACRTMGVELLDHFVLAGDKWTSLRRLKPW